MAAPTNYKFEGWMGLDKSSADGKMVWQEFEPKPFDERDVDFPHRLRYNFTVVHRKSLLQACAGS